MTTERIDTVDAYFQKVSRVNSWSSFLFWLSVICSFAVFLSSNKPMTNSILNIIFIITTVSYSFINNWLSLFLLREAQNKRRIHLLSDSLGVKLDDEETNLYYNNSQNPSIIRLGVNVFENTMFTWRVTEEMVKKESLKVIIYLLIWFALILIRNIDLNFIAIIAQTVFTTGLIVNCVKLLLLRNTCKQLFNEFRQIFLTNGLNNNEKAIATLLNLVFRYETVVASMGVHLSSNIFHKINPTVTNEWETIKRNVNL
jgi:hypothetical protein